MDGVWRCVDCGEPNASFHWPQCGYCEYDNEYWSGGWGGSYQQTSSQAIYEQDKEKIKDASAPREAALQGTSEAQHEKQQSKDSPDPTSTRIYRGELSTSKNILGDFTSATGDQQDNVQKTAATYDNPAQFEDNAVGKSPYSDLWTCGSCGADNFVANAPSVCPVCGHERDYGVGCCTNPGEAGRDIVDVGGQTTAGTSVDDDSNGMLPRDKQRRTAFYDYTAEKQMSHTEAKQFYQRHQWETQYGSSHQADGFSPVMHPQGAEDLESPGEDLELEHAPNEDHTLESTRDGDNARHLISKGDRAHVDTTSPREESLEWSKPLQDTTAYSALQGTNVPIHPEWEQYLKEAQERGELNDDLTREVLRRVAGQSAQASQVGSHTKSRRYSDSSASSYARSELSSASLASSATNLSLHSKYPAVQIEQATRELISILRDDEFLSALYERAVTDAKIGAQKLERNLRRFFKTYAEQLKQEAGDNFELQASRLVGIKARAVARLIVQKHETDNTTLRDVRYPNPTEQHESSSDDEVEPQPVNEELLQNLDDFRQFLTGSEAFQSLQKQLRSFVVPKAAKQSMKEQPFTALKDGHDDDDITIVARETDRMDKDCGDIETRTTLDDHMITNVFVFRHMGQLVKDCLAALTYEESTIQPGYTRLRWNCKCGHVLSGDVFEHVEGGVAETIERIRLSTGSDVVVTPSGQGRNTQTRTASMLEWFQITGRKLSAIWQRLTDKTPGLPHHSSPISTPARANPNTPPSQLPKLLLMSCMKRSKYFREVFQDGIDGIDTDQALFCFLQRQIKKRQWRIRRLFSFESIREIHFVKFELRASGYTKVHTHDLCPTSAPQTTCDRIPPKSMVEPAPGAEYRCKPHGPPKSCPPFFSDEMMHWLTSPKCIDPKASAVINQVPKRTKGVLQGAVGQPAEGWGLHFEEGWDFDLLISIILVVFLLASLLFAVLWSYFKLDVQGAFGVSSYIVTAMGIFVAWFANRAGKMG